LLRVSRPQLEATDEPPAGFQIPMIPSDPRNSPRLTPELIQLIEETVALRWKRRT
jgi:hypothetical protein